MALLDYGMGNLRSVAKALAVAGADVVVTSDGTTIGSADALCIPGQGVLDRCMRNIAELGLHDVVLRWISAERPYLGICLGMQLLFDHSEEAGGTDGFGLLRGEVTRLPGTVTVPHIGWNPVGEDHFYFDHSYAVHPHDESEDVVTGWCEHGERFAARIETGSITAVQFHPEKSGPVGLELLRKWVSASSSK